jgi:hypothetical protein
MDPDDLVQEAFVRTGDAVLVATSTRTDLLDVRSCADAGLYSPASNTWRSVPPLPISFGPNDTVAAKHLDGRVILELAGNDIGTRWFSYDEQTNQWSTYSPTARARRLFQLIGDATTGDAYVVVAAHAATAYDLVTNAVRNLAPPPDITSRNSMPPLWTGHELLFLGEADIPGHRGAGRYGGLRLGS